MPEFLEAARVDQVSSGTGTTVKVAGKAVAVFNIDGDVYAIGDSCPHAGASLGSGKLSGRIVTCRADGLRYDVTTGQVTHGEFGVPSYPVKVVDGKILIAVEYKLVDLLQCAQKPKANSGS